MTWLQIVNAVAALGAAAIWWWVALTSQRLGVQYATAAASLAGTVCIWYGVIYLLLGTGAISLTITSTVPLFRYVFVANILAPALAAGFLVRAIHGPVKSLREHGL